MCRIVRVSTSGYYQWLRRKPSKRAQEEGRLEVEIKAAHKRTRETCGPERLQRDLKEHGVKVGVCRIRAYPEEARVTLQTEEEIQGYHRFADMRCRWRRIYSISSSRQGRRMKSGSVILPISRQMKAGCISQGIRTSSQEKSLDMPWAIV